jgi:hypothetical protein
MVLLERATIKPFMPVRDWTVAAIRCQRWAWENSPQILRQPMPAAGHSGRFAESLIRPIRGDSGHGGFAVEVVGRDVIQAPKLEPRIMRYELSDYE